MEYSPREIEQKWQRTWAEQGTYRVTHRSDRPKYYVLDMFPYPSGAGLHVGHPLGYIASDIFSRYKRHRGFNVLHPMGYDAFGLPAEQYAIQTGVHPALSTEENIGRYRRQLDNLGFSFDWSREVKTCDPSYYKWTQRIFLLLFGHWYDAAAQKARPIAELEARFAAHGNAGLEAATTWEGEFSAAEWNAAGPARRDEILMNYRLAYRKMGHVNWCEALGTVLANDEVKDGVSERGGHPVVQRPMMQWTLRITAYAERLLAGLEQVDFSEALKVQQRHWIGKSEGARLFFPVPEKGVSIEIFTTRPDTVFGATFMVLAPEHPLVDTLTSAEQRPAVDEYLRYVSSRTERERQADAKKVTGVFTGSHAAHPLTCAPVPVWIGEYVLVGYGTGAIMAVPAHDERDHRFAEHFALPIVPVIDQSAHEGAGIEDKVGTLINSGPLDGLSVAEATKKAIALAEEKGLGKRQVNYRLRDANFSRQRYLGRAVPDRIRCRRRGPSRGSTAARTARSRQLQAHRRGQSPPRPFDRVGEHAPRHGPRNRHDAGICRLLLVFPALHGPPQRRGNVLKRGHFLLARRGSVCRRLGACRGPPAVLPFLAQIPARPRFRSHR